ncbi:hypothetical protein DIZ27_12665 [Streptomyces sp. NWU339]|uniref:hypothetical protein n=1 Tax=Streptomyces sp. NWU339 TaxID=2185284 RepID=UPI000D67CE14|nr:hypothetical protein [Streptomyces sp. NWU339]PWI09951.1 hypothetical protein DIZ27_12665 [Streptomyces sp. NWU339]
MAASGTGVMIIRVWVEEGSAQPLRAHIRLTDDVASGVERSMTLTRVNAVCRVVQEWLEEVLTDPDGG